MIKRLMDIALSLPALLVAAPLMAILWVLVRLESPGDPIYKQVRVGKDGEPFEIYKFRTMVTGAEFIGAGLAVQEGDERITRMGRLLRKTSLDELPNLLNVLRGEMSIHGRASLPWSERIELDLYYVEHQSLRLDLRILARTPAMLLGRKGVYKGEGGGWDITETIPQEKEPAEK